MLAEMGVSPEVSVLPVNILGGGGGVNNHFTSGGGYGRGRVPCRDS